MQNLQLDGGQPDLQESINFQKALQAIPSSDGVSNYRSEFCKVHPAHKKSYSTNNKHYCEICLIDADTQGLEVTPLSRLAN